MARISRRTAIGQIAGGATLLARHGQASGAPGVLVAQAGAANIGIAVWAPSDPVAIHVGRELQRHLDEMSGGRVPLVGVDTDVPEGTRVAISVQLDRTGRIRDEHFEVVARAGRVVIRGGGLRGVVYGCYALLEDVLGCRWYTRDVSVVPRRQSVIVPEVELREGPAFAYREPYIAEALNRDWALRNRLNGHFMPLDREVGGRREYGRFVHSMAELVPPERHFAEHPDWFALRDGVRLREDAQPCLTHPRVLEAAGRVLQQWIRKMPSVSMFSISQNDNLNYCMCSRCVAVEKAEGAASGAMLRFANQLADVARRERPGTELDVLAYLWTEEPPRLTRARQGVCVRFAPISACMAHGIEGCAANEVVMRRLRGWAARASSLYAWLYTGNFACFLQPMPDLEGIASTLRSLQLLGASGVFIEGAYSAGGGGNLSELRAFVLSKLLWKPERPLAPLIAEFARAVYSDAGDAVIAWLELLHSQTRAVDVHSRVFDGPHAAYLPAHVLAYGDRLLLDAETSLTGDARRRIQSARLGIQYVQLMRSDRGSDARRRLVGALAAGVAQHRIEFMNENLRATDFVAKLLRDF